MNHIRYVNKTDAPLNLGGIDIPPSGQYITDTSNTVLDSYDGILLDKYINGVSILDTVEYNSRKVVVSSEKGAGLRLDTSNPQYGWQDLLSPTIIYAGAASNKPTFQTLIGGIKEYQFVLNDESFHEFHLPHDYAPGTNLYIHTHWTHNNASAVSGNLTWNFEVIYAKGYSQEAFSAPINIPVTQSVEPYLTHMIAETQLSSLGGTLDTARIETDGIMKVRLSLVGNTITPATNPFMMYCDIHYQSTGVPTKNRNFDFWI